MNASRSGLLLAAASVAVAATLVPIASQGQGQGQRQPAARPATPTPATGEVREFRDWMVVCDNVRGCTALSLSRASGGSDFAPVLSVTRAAGPRSAARLELLLPPPMDGQGADSLPTSAQLVIEGQPPFPLTPDAATQSLAVPPAQTARFLAAARPASIATAEGVDNPREDGSAPTISLSGLVAALRHMDAVQGRTGSQTALIDTGPAPAARVPAAAAVPQVRAVRFAARPVGVVPRAVRTAAREQCGGPDSAGDLRRSIEAFDLGLGRALWVVPCGLGAYNASSLVMVSDARGQATGLIPGAPAAALDQTEAIWINLDVDPAQGVLTQFYKGRGLGDCGRADTMAWTGQRFEPVSVTLMDTCRGMTSERWPVLYRATLLPSR